MIKSDTPLASVTAQVTSVVLRPRFNDYRTRGDVTNPVMGYCCKCAIPYGTEILTGTVWFPAEIRGDDEISPLGVESGTPAVPQFDRNAASAATSSDECVMIDANGHPVPADSEPAGTSHWAIARFIPCHRARVTLTGVTLRPCVVDHQYVFNSRDQQSVYVSYIDGAIERHTQAPNDGPGVSGKCAKGAKMPDWAAAEAAEAAASAATAAVAG